MTDKTEDLIPMGAELEPYGKVGMIGNISGERYYWFTKENYVAMMPASLVEPQYFKKEVSVETMCDEVGLARLRLRRPELFNKQEQE